MIRDEDEINESQEVPVRPEYKIPKAAQEVKDELLGGKPVPQDQTPKSAKIMKFM